MSLIIAGQISLCLYRQWSSYNNFLHDFSLCIEWQTILFYFTPHLSESYHLCRLFLWYTYLAQDEQNLLSYTGIFLKRGIENNQHLGRFIAIFWTFFKQSTFIKWLHLGNNYISQMKVQKYEMASNVCLPIEYEGLFFLKGLTWFTAAVSSLSSSFSFKFVFPKQLYVVIYHQ